MRKFELWLDESGNFDNDSEKIKIGKNPSLVGGLLIENNTFPSNYINAIIPETKTYHSTNENDQLDRFRQIDKKLYLNNANQFVVFSNQECIMILDNNLTYLNIISEGILQLIKQLKAQYGEIFLRVIIANRVNTTTGLNPAQSTVPSEEYTKRLKEKLLLASLENSISDKEWSLQNASALKDKRLMLADIVCNAFLTRSRRKKFGDEGCKYIESIYNDKQKTLKFTVFEPVLEKNFKNSLMDNQIGEAVSSICLSNNKEALERCFSLLKLNFNTRSVYDITFQYKFIEAYIEYYVNVVRNFDLCINYMNNLLNYYIPLLIEYNKNDSKNLANKLALDIKFYMLTVYTHMGNIQMFDKLVDECEKAISELPTSLDTINYQIKFETRKITHLINAFNFKKALSYADSQVKKCKEIKELMSLISNENSYYYDELAKALGTRLQIKTFLIRNNAKLYSSAKEDSNNAINEFVDESDKRRQYLYRVQLETEHEDFEEALKYLKMSVGQQEETNEKTLWNAVEKESPFAISAFIRLMSEGTGQWEKSEVMYNALSSSDYILKLESQTQLYHPSEIILWKYGYYYAQNGMIPAAIKYYEKASDVCFYEDNLTLNVIGIGIELELHGIILQERKKEVATHSRRLNKRWNKTKESDFNDILGNLFGKIDFQNDNPQYFKSLGRKITY